MKCARIHCGIRYWDDIFVIRDMSSSNGTFVNEKQIEVSKLAPGDTVRIGGTTIRMESDATSSDVTMRA